MKSTSEEKKKLVKLLLGEVGSVIQISSEEPRRAGTKIEICQGPNE